MCRSKAWAQHTSGQGQQHHLRGCPDGLSLGGPQRPDARHAAALVEPLGSYRCNRLFIAPSSPLGSSAFHYAVSFLLDNLPGQVTLAITTRADPPLPLSRLGARDELAELRASDLRFTDDEATRFLNDVMGPSLEPELVAALETRTEG